MEPETKIPAANYASMDWELALSESNFRDVPEDITICIFNEVIDFSEEEMKTLSQDCFTQYGSFSLVCKQWNILCGEDNIIKTLFKRGFLGDEAREIIVNHDQDISWINLCKYAKNAFTMIHFENFNNKLDYEWQTARDAGNIHYFKPSAERIELARGSFYKPDERVITVIINAWNEYQKFNETEKSLINPDETFYFAHISLRNLRSLTDYHKGFKDIPDLLK
jgi:hypothetical protein